MDISVIIPLNEVKDITLLKNAISSVEKQKYKAKEIILVINVNDKITMENSQIRKIEGVKIVENESENSFQSQVNKGIEVSKYDYISILEFDDELSEIWFKNVFEYSKHYSEFDIFLPITINVIEKEGKHLTVGFSNEAALAHNFTQKMGIIDLDSVLNFPNFSIVGGVIKKDNFIENGCFKEGIKYSFVYELFLRQIDNGSKIMVIPRLGYKHLLEREGSISFNNSFVSRNEGKFWIDTAKREYHFKKDRIIEYKSFE